jgi:hypothetical protein
MLRCSVLVQVWRIRSDEAASHISPFRGQMRVNVASSSKFGAQASTATQPPVFSTRAAFFSRRADKKRLVVIRGGRGKKGSKYALYLFLEKIIVEKIDYFDYRNCHYPAQMQLFDAE